MNYRVFTTLVFLVFCAFLAGCDHSENMDFQDSLNNLGSRAQHSARPSFLVAQSGYSISLATNTFSPGQPFSVSYVMPSGTAMGALVVVPSGSSPVVLSAVMLYSSAGQAVLYAPYTAGTYELRLMTGGGVQTSSIIYVSSIVRPAPSPSSSPIRSPSAAPSPRPSSTPLPNLTPSPTPRSRPLPSPTMAPPPPTVGGTSGSGPVAQWSACRYLATVYGQQGYHQAINIESSQPYVVIGYSWDPQLTSSCSGSYNDRFNDFGKAIGSGTYYFINFSDYTLVKWVWYDNNGNILQQTGCIDYTKVPACN